MYKLKTILFGFISLVVLIAVADQADDRLETNIKDRMQNLSSIDQKQPKELKDSAITKEIEDNLKNSTLSDYGRNVKVISAHGQVTLKGLIPSHQEEAIILEKVRSVAGVKTIFNEMKIIPEK